jgi:two-component system, chemotaxis family, sensor kinase Cph1
VASHDLQEPLRMVSNFTQLLARRYKDKLDSEAQEFISFAVGGALRMQTLINDLLEYSRVRRKGKPFVSVDCAVVLSHALANLNGTIQSSGARVTADPLPTITGDSGQMLQLFQNLISNAIKFRGKEPPLVHINAQSCGEQWRFSVADNGIGIAADHYDRIFVIFQRLHSYSEYPGTGIGLAICKRIVERHGGRIWVESKPGQGTTFWFSIPMRPTITETTDTVDQAPNDGLH